jgi:hypothetical protein
MIAMPDWRRRQSLPDGTAPGGHHSGGTRHKDVRLISPTSHYGQWGKPSFKFSDEKKQFLSQLVGDREGRASGSTPFLLYHRRKPEQWFRTHAWDNVWRARRLSFLTTHAVQCLTHCEWGTELACQQCQVYPAWRGSREGEPPRPRS